MLRVPRRPQRRVRPLRPLPTVQRRTGPPHAEGDMTAVKVYRYPDSKNVYYLCEHHARIAAAKSWVLVGKLDLGEDECEACQ